LIASLRVLHGCWEERCQELRFGEVCLGRCLLVGSLFGDAADRIRQSRCTLEGIQIEVRLEERILSVGLAETLV
jgi:hypothetical protein